jgi:ADP-ribosylglycohydrolase
VSDAYGAGFEFTSTKFIQKHNKLDQYIPHPKHERPEGTYTDDTQMTLGLVEHLLSDDPWTPGKLATRWVQGFQRDPRTGYASHFYDFLKGLPAQPSNSFLDTIQPHSLKNGGAMRAFPCGFLPTPVEVRDKAMFQASLTHATYEGMQAAAAAALTFHYCYYQGGKRDGLGAFLQHWLPGTDWIAGTTPRGQPTGGVPTVQKAIAVLLRCQSLADAIHMAVGLGGDTDTVAAIVAPCAAVCTEVRNAVPPFLLDKLENGTFGRDYLRAKELHLLAKYPVKPTPLVVQAPRNKVKPAPPPKKLEESEEGPLDFLFSNV